MAESSRKQDRLVIDQVLDQLITSQMNPAMRIGISGAPGVGKSTLIEAVGNLLLRQSHRVAVLAVDPTSSRSGGSILGDKTRMGTLSANPNAYVRPSPAGSSLGGVGSATGAAVLLCEAAGFDVVLVETVGVGQSETAVAQITDLFVLLVAPASGDDLQGIKRGVMELADVVAITKHDGRLRDSAAATASAYSGALALLRNKHAEIPTEILALSALEGEGIDQLWSVISGIHRQLVSKGVLNRMRASQATSAFWAELGAMARRAHEEAVAGDDSLAELVGDVRQLLRHPRSAADEFWSRSH